MARAREEAACALKRAVEDMKRFYDRKRKPEEYNVGDQVWSDTRNLTTDRPKKKLDHKRLGPFKITHKISNVVYKLELPPSWRIHPVFQCIQVAVFHSRPLQPASSPR